MCCQAATVTFDHVVLAGCIFADEALGLVPLLLGRVGSDRGHLQLVCTEWWKIRNSSVNGTKAAVAATVKLASLLKHTAATADGTGAGAGKEVCGQVDINGVANEAMAVVHTESRSAEVSGIKSH